MRIWTIHPCYLDGIGLTALWREALLAQAVLLGRTKGYRQHPQLMRFRHHCSPVAAIASYLAAVYAESVRRGYRFDSQKIQPERTSSRIPETEGQLRYEWRHFSSKLAQRNPSHLKKVRRIAQPQPHPLFEIVPGCVRTWEKRKPG